MKFNLASTIKTVAQRLNPDLEIPNAPAPASPPKNATASRKTPSPPLPQSSFSASSSPTPKRPRASRSASWTKTRNRAASNVSSAFRKSSASIALPVFMGKMPEVDEKMGSEEAVEEDRAPVIVCRDFAVTEVARPQITGSKKVEAEIKGLGVMEDRIMGKVTEGEVMGIPMDSPQRPGTPVDLPMLTVETADTMLPVLAKLPPITIWGPQETDSVAPVPPPPPPAIPEVKSTTVESHPFPLRVSSLVPLAIQLETNTAMAAAATTPAAPSTKPETKTKPEKLMLPKPSPTSPQPTKNPSPSPSPTPTLIPSSTSTCLCTAIHLSFPLLSSLPPQPQPHYHPKSSSPSLCPCLACSKTNASVYASSGYSLQQAHLTHIRGRDNLTCYTHTHTHTHTHDHGDAVAGAEMSTMLGKTTTTTKHFCKTCGTLMYSVGSGLPGFCTLYLNSVDDALRLGRERDMGMKMERVRGGVGGGIGGGGGVGGVR